MSLPLNPLRALEGAELVRFATALARSPEHWQALVLGRGGERVYEAIWSDEHVNAWVIRWSEHSDTGFHDHDVSASAIVVMEGSVVEERLALGGPPAVRRFTAGQSFHLAASAIHRVRHDGASPSLTIHVYSPPLRRQGVYRSGPDGALERDATPYTEELRAEPSPLRG